MDSVPQLVIGPANLEAVDPAGLARSDTSAARMAFLRNPMTRVGPIMAGPGLTGVGVGTRGRK